MGLGVTEAELNKMMTAERAAELTIEACESGAREVVFGKQLQKLVKLRASQPVRVDRILSKQYNKLHANTVPSKL